MIKQMVTGFLLCACSVGSATAAHNDNDWGDKGDRPHEKRHNVYEVTITNTTVGQSFTPQLAFTHPKAVKLFNIGDVASEPLEALAEGGSTAELTDELEGSVYDIKTNGLLLAPGQSTTFKIRSTKRRRNVGYLTLAAMLIPTNDTFMALNSFPLPRRGQVASIPVFAYDAGTEENDQNCANIPGGGECSGGEGVSLPAAGDEGFIHISNGFHDLGRVDEANNTILAPQRYDWRNHVAEITVRRVR